MRATLWRGRGEFSDIVCEVLRALFTLAGIDFAVVDTGEAILATAAHARRTSDHDILVIDCSTGTPEDIDRCLTVSKGTQLAIHIVHPREQAVRDLEAVTNRRFIWYSTTATLLDLRDKLQLLRSLAEAAATPDRPVLTAREREVAALLTAGLTNAEIAEQLHMAKDTAKKHVHALYQKFGVASRRAFRQKYQPGE